MTFDARERSLRDGRPLRLYEFAYGPATWRYASGDRDQFLLVQTWRSLTGGIIDEGIRQSGDPSSDALTITVPPDLPVVALLRTLPPTEEIAVVVRDVHVGDGEARVCWVGSLVDAKRRGEAVELACENLLASMARGGLSLGWERSCPYAVYDHNCRKNRADYRTTASLIAVTGTTVEAGAFGAHPDTWFPGGYIEWETPEGAFERRFIKAQSGGVLTLLGGTPGLPVGLTVDAYAGCDRSAQTCVDKFDNIDNFGGFSMLPGKSPFDGTLVF